MGEEAKKFMKISIWLTAILLIARFLISWVDVKRMWETGNIFSLSYNLFGFIGEAIGIAAIFMSIFNKWAWKWKCFKWTHDLSVLSKKYEGTIISDYDGVKRLVMLNVNQTFLAVKVEMKTDESSSRSLIASFVKMQGVQYLIYTYQNDPRAEIQDRSPMHYGTSMLNVSNENVLEGNYYTGRKTRGSMIFEAIE